MGADVVIDYHKTNWTDVVADRSVDFVYDTVGIHGTGDLSIPKLADHGVFVTLEGSGLASKATMKTRPDARQQKPECIMGCVQHGKLEAISKMVEDGKLRPHLEQIYPLSNTVGALNHSMSGHTAGKVVIEMNAEESVVV
mmetsp:Transcript_40065/g.87446  ORF Transcript_40065/g.87446 Transcript_40065/m.87446 type:complete len:140 (+) Transcript_40065:2-421(+)